MAQPHFLQWPHSWQERLNFSFLALLNLTNEYLLSAESGTKTIRKMMASDRSRQEQMRKKSLFSLHQRQLLHLVHTSKLPQCNYLPQEECLGCLAKQPWLIFCLSVRWRGGHTGQGHNRRWQKGTQSHFFPTWLVSITRMAILQTPLSIRSRADNLWLMLKSPPPPLPS